MGCLNVALSVALTAFSGIAAVAIMPLALAVIAPIALGLEAFGVPIAELAFRLLLFLVLPVGAGMLLRHLWPAALERYDGAIRGAGPGLLALFLAIVVVDQQDAVFAMISEATRVTVSFTSLALLTGWLVGRLFGLNGPDRTVLAIEFAVRNVAIVVVAVPSAIPVVTRMPHRAAFFAAAGGSSNRSSPGIEGSNRVYRRPQMLEDSRPLETTLFSKSFYKLIENPGP